MSTQPILRSAFVARMLLIPLSGCEKTDETLFPLAGYWKPTADRTTRLQYTSGGQTYDVSYTKTGSPSGIGLIVGGFSGPEHGQQRWANYRQCQLHPAMKQPPELSAPARNACSFF